MNVPMQTKLPLIGSLIAFFSPLKKKIAAISEEIQAITRSFEEKQAAFRAYRSEIVSLAVQLALLQRNAEDYIARNQYIVVEPDVEQAKIDHLATLLESRIEDQAAENEMLKQQVLDAEKVLTERCAILEEVRKESFKSLVSELEQAKLTLYRRKQALETLKSSKEANQQSCIANSTISAMESAITGNYYEAPSATISTPSMLYK